MPKPAYNRERWYIETHELRCNGKVIFSADLSNSDGGWARVWHEAGFLSRADAKNEAIAKIQELEAA